MEAEGVGGVERERKKGAGGWGVGFWGWIFGMYSMSWSTVILEDVWRWRRGVSNVQRWGEGEGELHGSGAFC